MSAEWILQSFAYDEKRLAAFVGGGKVVRVPRDLVDDDRVGDVSLVDAIAELASGKLESGHAMAYRIALEAIMTAIGKRAHPRVTTYALKEDIGRVASRLGLRTLGAAWNKPKLSFPKPALARAIDWPMALSLDAKSVLAAAAETKALQRTTLAARVLELMPKDPDFADDVAEVIGVLATVVQKVARARSPLMILVDGEQ